MTEAQKVIEEGNDTPMSLQDKKHEEMVRRVKEIADYAIETGVVSTRQIAQHFSEHRFKISNATVCAYLSQRLPKIDPVRYASIKPLIDKNTPKSIETVEVRKRIYIAVALLLRGLTIPQIVEEMNSTRSDDEKVTFDIIYDDLTRRLKSIEKDQDILEDVKRRLSENRLDTLNNQGINGPNMAAQNQPRINGRFATTKEDTISKEKEKSI